MAVSDRDRARMRRLSADLADSETDDPGTPAQRASRLAWINARRAEIGMPPLVDEAPEEGCSAVPEPSEWLASTGEVLDRLVDALRAAGYDVDVLRDPAAPPHLLRLRRGPERVDLLPPVIAFQQAALSRASEGVVTAEDDLIVFKLIAWRPRDRDDVRSILEAGVPLDDDYIDGWVREWDVADRWRQARRWRPDA